MLKQKSKRSLIKRKCIQCGTKDLIENSTGATSYTYICKRCKEKKE